MDDPNTPPTLSQGRDYMDRHDKHQRSPAGPIAAFAFLAGVTIVAFLTQGPPRTTQQASANTVVPEQSNPGSLGVNQSFDEAVSALEATLATNPFDTLALASLVELMLASHQPDQALEVTSKWIQASPDSPDAWLQRTMAFAALERWEDALGANQVLLNIDPSRLLTHLNMGAIHGNLGDAEEARRWWTGVIETAPGTDEALAAERSLAQMAQQEAGNSSP